LGTFAWKSLWDRAFRRRKSGASGIRPVLYAGATDCPRIEGGRDAEIVLAPGAAQERFRRPQEWREEEMAIDFQ
jgi:hypothetical protein